MIILVIMIILSCLILLIIIIISIHSFMNLHRALFVTMRQLSVCTPACLPASASAFSPSV